LSPQRGEEFVGMQGDIWDAQQDMFLATLGAIIAMGATAFLRRRQHSEAPLHAGAASTVRY
jgi:putative membrane protein